ncbi:undecaprenyl-diphosphate phosphatase [Paenibacillus sp. F411]|uniref:Undecaprenyl-diphosphatase n=1 Tax=Paenibacillus algicola TaxID=2565926 RepID=A0A4V1G3I6_9BACL|nr:MULTISPECIES: undecaprenyl-diphosphate phosphatase [Paenibacillus]MBO2945321.1 undecaprenyl-diphosphate phosphatase [Paenibacillus sp. F411]QCT01324.1 undecaprenol kinase [Paenibacillus algicola]
MDFVLFMKAVILGMVEGLTEFAPVSSTGHMIIMDDMWLKSEEFLGKYVANTFKVVVQLGSILAVVIVFWSRFMDLLGIRRKQPAPGAEHGRRLKLAQVIVGLLPAGLLGVFFEDIIDEYLFSVETVMIGLAAGAVLMIVADRFSRREPQVTTVDQMTYKQALGVGLFQCLSVILPGFSRSGSTISGGVMLGMSHRAAADFTFIMAVPIMFGASLISLVKNLEYFSMSALPFFIAGFISAFLFALISIRFFLKLINRIKLVPFAIYRLVLAAVIFIVWIQVK